MASLVTGIGYMGAALVEALLARGEQVIGLENYFSTDPAVLSALCARGLTLCDGDVTDPAAVAAAFAVAPINTVYHFAAQASANPAAASIDYTERTNLQGPRVVLDAAVQHGVSSFVYASSFKVYGEPLTGQISEAHPYGTFRDMSHLSKVHAEKLLEMYAAQHPLRALSLRYGIVHGLGPLFKTDQRFMTAPNKFCLQIVQGETLNLYGGGQAPAGWVHLAAAINNTLAAVAQAPVGYTPCNVVDEVVAVAEVARLVQEAAQDRGLQATIAGLQPAATPPEPFAVSSSLPLPAPLPGTTLCASIPAVLDYCQRLVDTAERVG